MSIHQRRLIIIATCAAALLLGLLAHGMETYSALAMLESGDNDAAIGKAGEVSRYQICPAVWRQYTTLPLTAATNPLTARNVAAAIMQDRCNAFAQAQKRQPSAFEFYLLWHRPALVNRHLSRTVRDRAQRFENLIAKN